jgi:hypothetical protein
MPSSARAGAPTRRFPTRAATASSWQTWPEVLERLRKIWTDPQALNPARISAAVTRHVAALLAALAVSLEGGIFKLNQPITPVEPAQAAPEIVAAYLTRCLFCMFAEDVKLLPKGAFIGLLQAHRTEPTALQQMLRILWADMDRGGFTAALAKNVLRFNGKLFKGSATDDYSLLLTTAQINLLIRAAQTNWREVEPAILAPCRSVRSTAPNATPWALTSRRAPMLSGWSYPPS